jgi:hypothetical protein
MKEKYFWDYLEVSKLMTSHCMQVPPSQLLNHKINMVQAVAVAGRSIILFNFLQSMITI